MDGHHLLPGAAPESLERAARDLAPGALAPGARASRARVVPREVGAAVIAGAAAPDGATPVNLERAEDLTRDIGALEREARVVHLAGDLARVANLRDRNALPGVVHPGVAVPPPGVPASRARVVTREVGPLEVHGALESLERAVLDLIRKIGAMIGHPETVGMAADLASRARVDLVLSNGMMTGHQPITLGMAPASLERVVHLEVVTLGQHLHGAVLESLERVVLDLEVGALTPGAAPALDGAVLASRARVVPREVGAPLEAHGALVSLERAADLTRDGAVPAPDGATPANLERAEDLIQVGDAVTERVANLRDRREDLTGELALLHGTLPPPPGVPASRARVVTREVGPLEVHGALESLERVVAREAGMVMAGTDGQVDGHQVASQARVDHGIKPVS